MKTILSMTLAALAGFLVLCMATVPATTRAALDGQELYKEYCKGCHAAGSPNGEYTPLDLIQDQWTRFFDRKYERTHKDVMDSAHGNRPVIEVIGPEELQAIREFAVDHAADSENPMTCG